MSPEEVPDGVSEDSKLFELRRLKSKGKSVVLVEGRENFIFSPALTETAPQTSNDTATAHLVLDTHLIELLSYRISPKPSNAPGCKYF